MTKARRGVKRSATRIMAAYSGAVDFKLPVTDRVDAAAIVAGDTGQPADYDALSYRDLQALAKAAGMRSVGVSRVDLISGLQGNEQ